MGRPTTRKRTAVMKALIELRARTSQTQQSMAHYLGCALQSIARWETVMEPQGYVLHMLADIARVDMHNDLAEVFEAAIAKSKLEDRRRAEEIEADVKRWYEIKDLLLSLEDEGAAMSDKQNPLYVKPHPAGPRIQQKAMKLMELTEQARRLAWRNR